MTSLDRRRLSDGAIAMHLGKPLDKKAIQDQVEQLHDALAAMQSLDDLGSPEANERAMQQCYDLQKKIESLNLLL